MAAIAVAAGISGRALAFLETGTLLTNAASATYLGGSQGTSVTYSATAKILVANPAVFLWKDATPTCVSATAGGYVTFRICFSNGGANTAYNLTITDKLPPNTYFYACNAANYEAWVAGGTVTPAANPASSANGNPPWLETCPTMTSRYLRWVMSRLAIGSSGCIRFTVSIGN